MKELNVEIKNDNYKIGTKKPKIKPNITEDTILLSEGVFIGAYYTIKEENLKNLLNICNYEFMQSYIPKKNNIRFNEGKYKSINKGTTNKVRNRDSYFGQFSSIVGSVGAKFSSRPVPKLATIHSEEKAKNFIKALFKVSQKSEEIFKVLNTQAYLRQKKKVEENIPKKFRFGSLFSSVICNKDYAVDCHIDGRNMTDCYNFIYIKKNSCDGGDVCLPEYNLCFDCKDNVLIILNAKSNLHAVTELKKHNRQGYRNSFVFYTLNF